jgi:hypothetical protein
VEKLPYLQQLGINAIELLPVHEFNELEYHQARPAPAGPPEGDRLPCCSPLGVPSADRMYNRRGGRSALGCMAWRACSARTPCVDWAMG